MGCWFSSGKRHIRKTKPKKSSLISSKFFQQQRQTLEIVEDTACEDKNFWKYLKISHYSFIVCYLFFLCFFFCFFFFLFQSSEQTPKPEKNSRKVPVVKMSIFLFEKSSFGTRWTRRLGVAHLRVTPLSCFSRPFFAFSISLKKKELFLIFTFFLSNISNCYHWYQCLTMRCGVLTTQGGIAGIGLGHLLGKEHDSTPQSGLEAPRLLNGASPDWIIAVVSDTS